MFFCQSADIRNGLKGLVQLVFKIFQLDKIVDTII